MRILLTFMVCVLAVPALALDLPVDVSADSLDVFQQEDKAVFKGSVKVKHGDVMLGSDNLEVFYDTKDGAGVKKVVAQKDVVIVHGKNTATGDKAVYEIATGNIVLTGGVVLSRDGSVLTGERLVYDMETGQMRLANETKKGRVKASFSLKGNN